MHNQRTAAKQFLLGVVVITTFPVWWALIAVGMMGWIVWMITRSIGEGAEDALQAICGKSA